MTYLNSTGRMEMNGGVGGYGYGAGSYGMGSGQANPYYAYEQQLLQYISQVRSALSTLQQGSSLYNQYSQYLNTAYSYLQQVDPQMAMSGDGAGGYWDPMAGQYPGMDGGMPGSEGATDGPIPSYQDQTKILFEDKIDGSITAIKSESREVHFYTPPYDFNVPSSTKATASQTTDANGEKVIKVDVKWADGTTRSYFFHNVDWQNFKLDLHAGSPEDQITIDASVTGGKVTKSELGSEDEGLSGDAPDETDTTTRTWNKRDSVNYFVTEGTEIDTIYADNVDITLENRSQKAVITKLGENEYDIEIQDAQGNVIRKIHCEQVDQINLKGVDKAYVTYKSSVSAAEVPWDRANDSKVSLGGKTGGAQSGDPVNPNFYLEDTATTSFSTDGKIANYTGQTDVTLHTYLDGAVTNSVIDAAGEVTLYPADSNSKIYLSLLYENGKVYYIVKEVGANGKSMEYKIDAEKAGKLKIMAPSSQIDTSFLDIIQDSQIGDKNADFLRGKIENQSGEPVTQKSADSETPKALQDLSRFSGAAEEQIIEAIKSTYIDAPANEEDFKKWMKTNFNPPKMDKNLLKLVMKIDPQMRQLLSSLNGKKMGDAMTASFGNIRDRILVDLKSVFPSANITPVLTPSGLVFSCNGSAFGFNAPVQADGITFGSNITAENLMFS